MSGNQDGLRILAKYAEGIDLHYFPNAFAEIVPSIDYGILFLMAFWSGPSISAFVGLTKAMRDLHAVDLELVVIDVDGQPNVYQLPHVNTLYGGAIAAPTGRGEAAFCRQGKIVQGAVLGQGKDVDQFYRNACELLKRCRAA